MDSQRCESGNGRVLACKCALQYLAQQDSLELPRALKPASSVNPAFPGTTRLILVIYPRLLLTLFLSIFTIISLIEPDCEVSRALALADSQNGIQVA